MADKYDKAIEYLTEHPEKIDDAWHSPAEIAEGCLFMFLGDGECIGCPSMVKDGYWVAATAELTTFVRQHSGIPYSSEKITPDHLPAFAEIQRRADKELGRPA